MARRSRRNRKLWYDPIVLGLCLMPFSILCIVLGFLSPLVRWVFIVGAAVDLVAAAGFYLYIVMYHDEETTLFGVEDAPRTFISSVVMILAFVQLGLYVIMTRTWW